MEPAVGVRLEGQRGLELCCGETGTLWVTMEAKEVDKTWGGSSHVAISAKVCALGPGALQHIGRGEVCGDAKLRDDARLAFPLSFTVRSDADVTKQFEVVLVLRQRQDKPPFLAMESSHDLRALGTTALGLPLTTLSRVHRCPIRITSPLDMDHVLHRSEHGSAVSLHLTHTASQRGTVTVHSIEVQATGSKVLGTLPVEMIYGEKWTACVIPAEDGPETAVCHMQYSLGGGPLFSWLYSTVHNEQYTAQPVIHLQYPPRVAVMEPFVLSVSINTASPTPQNLDVSSAFPLVVYDAAIPAPNREASLLCVALAPGALLLPQLGSHRSSRHGCRILAFDAAAGPPDSRAEATGRGRD